MLNVTLDEFNSLLDQAPIIADIHPVSLNYLSDIRILNLEEAIQELDMPLPSLSSKIVIIDSKSDDKFIRVRVNHDPLTPEINKILFDQFDEISQKMLKQSNIVDHIARESNADVIILYLIDGLGYWDVKKNPPNFGEIIPCIVDCPSITDIAFKNLLGTMPISKLLYDEGYVNFFGFSYWNKDDNKLTDDLFSMFSNVYKAQDFDTIMEILKDRLKANSFVQIVRQGLDGLCHRQKIEPPIAAILDQIYRTIHDLIELSNKKGLSVQIFVTSDHGILWYHDFEPKIINNSTSCSPRYCYSRRKMPNSKHFEVNGENYYCLNYPFLTRSLRIDEKGVHGGISFQESLVPLMKVKNYD